MLACMHACERSVHQHAHALERPSMYVVMAQAMSAEPSCIRCGRHLAVQGETFDDDEGYEDGLDDGGDEAVF